MCEIDVWLDEWEIAPGDSIYQAINNGILTSKYVALIISKAFLESKWASEEVESAFSKQMNQKNKIILPLLLENVNLPPLLDGKLFISFMENYYNSLTRLAGILHEIPLKSISQAILNTNPKNIDDTKKTLEYCGLNPAMIIPKEVFDEIAKSGDARVKDDHLWIDNDYSILTKPFTENTKYYLRRILGGG